MNNSRTMVAIHIPESEAAEKFASLITSARAGVEVVVESDSIPVADLKTPLSKALTLKERIDLLPDNSSAIMDEEFALDVQEAIDAHREPLDSSAWD